MNKNIIFWMRQPSTVAGCSAFVGIVLALLLHQLNFLGALPLMGGALVSMILPDNGGARQEAEHLGNELIEHNDSGGSHGSL